MPPLTPALRRSLRARAHAIDPVVAIGHAGLTPAVMREVDVALKAHELVKVRVHSDDRDERESHLAAICEALDAAPVQHLGKLLIVWRPAPKQEEPVEKPRRRAGKKSGARPEARRRGEPKIGARAQKHRRGAARHERGPMTIDAPRGRRAVEPTVPSTTAPRGRRYVGGKPAVSPRAKAGAAQGAAQGAPKGASKGAPPDVRRRRRPTGRRG